MKIDETYMEKLANTVAEKIVEAFENITIDDIDLYRIGYNNAAKEFSERLKLDILADDNALFDKITLYKIVDKIKEGMELV